VLLYQRPESKWLFALATRYTFLGDEIEDSPIVNDDGELMGLLAIGYTFGR
jgi:outer membrane scaffolding protein for murein synthesis (MipA/OmpV family)